MGTSERVAIAAHLHVALRRKAGRVTDTDWVAVNDEYAWEVVRIARAKAQEDGDASLSELAEKLAAVLQTESQKKVVPPPIVDRVKQSLREPAPQVVRQPEPEPVAEPEDDAGRYIGGLR